MTLSVNYGFQFIRRQDDRVQMTMKFLDGEAGHVKVRTARVAKIQKALRPPASQTAGDQQVDAEEKRDKGKQGNGEGGGGMNNRQIAAVYEDLKKLAGNEIRNAGGSDLVTAWRLYEKLEALVNLQYCAANFRILLESTEDEESRELAQKHQYIFMTTVYMDYLEEVIGTAAGEKAGSAGMARLLQETCDSLVPVRDFFQREFGE